MAGVTGLQCLSAPWPPGDPCRHYAFLVCCIPSPVIGTLPYTEPLSIRILRDVRGFAIKKSQHDLLLESVAHRERNICHVFASSMPQTFTSIVPSADSAPSPQTSARCFSRQPSRPI